MSRALLAAFAVAFLASLFAGAAAADDAKERAKTIALLQAENKQARQKVEAEIEAQKVVLAKNPGNNQAKAAIEKLTAQLEGMAKKPSLVPARPNTLQHVFAKRESELVYLSRKMKLTATGKDGSVFTALEMFGGRQSPEGKIEGGTEYVVSITLAEPSKSKVGETALVEGWFSIAVVTEKTAPKKEASLKRVEWTDAEVAKISKGAEKDK